MADGGVDMHQHRLGKDQLCPRPLVAERHGDILQPQVPLQLGMLFNRQFQLARATIAAGKADGGEQRFRRRQMGTAATADLVHRGGLQLADGFQDQLLVRVHLARAGLHRSAFGIETQLAQRRHRADGAFQPPLGSALTVSVPIKIIVEKFAPSVK